MTLAQSLLSGRRPLTKVGAHRQLPSPPPKPAAVEARARDYADVDVAIVMESTYLYLKGGVSAVVHDIVTANPDLTYGIIHVSWDRNSPSEDLYAMPENVVWVRPLFLSIQEHQHDFSSVRSEDLKMNARQRAALSERFFDALFALADDADVEPLWTLLDEGMLESTREFPLWALLGTREFMLALTRRLPQLALSLSDAFWLVRGFFSLAHAVLSETMPRARVYHAHTTGYASLIGAAAAREHRAAFLLTEHNLYVRDTVNTLLDRNMALSLTSTDYRTFDVETEQRAWMAWWTEIGHFCYPSASLITYLYPSAITEAAALGAPVDRSLVVPNGMVIEQFEAKYRARLRATEQIVQDSTERVWQLAYIARVVPIKGLMDLLDTLALMIERGAPHVHLHVMGPTEHTPAYYEQCLAKIDALGLDDIVTIHGTVNVRERLDQFDLLVMSSYNEGQPIVALEAMSAAIPTVSTRVGGMSQLIEEDLQTPTGTVWGPAGILTDAGDFVGMADAIGQLIENPQQYAVMGANARGRVEDFFQMHEVMASYNQLYRMLGAPLDAEQPVISEVVPPVFSRIQQAEHGPMLEESLQSDSLVKVD